MLSFEEIGALLGFVAFAGLAVLVFLTFQQARHIRRLRDWAGRAPERAAAEAAREAGEPADAEIPVTGEEDATGDYATGDYETGDYEETAERESRLTMFRHDMALRFEDFDRRSPVDAKILLAGIAVIIVGLAIATSGFGLIGGSDSSSDSGDESSSSGKEASASEEPSVKVAVLNGTAPPGGTGVSGVADSVSKDVEDAGFKVSDVGDAGSFTTSIVMWRGDAEGDAQDLGDSMSDLLGDTDVVEMTPEVEDLVGKADVALIVGQDDSGT